PTPDPRGVVATPVPSRPFRDGLSPASRMVRFRLQPFALHERGNEPISELNNVKALVSSWFSFSRARGGRDAGPLAIGGAGSSNTPRNVTFRSKPFTLRQRGNEPIPDLFTSYAVDSLCALNARRLSPNLGKMALTRGSRRRFA